MKPRLLIDIEVIEYVARLKKGVRERLYRRFESIREAPGHHTEFTVRHRSGRTLDGCIEGHYAILFWDDFADRHVKIMSVTLADKVELD